MTEVFSLYRWAIFAGLIGAINLALIGCHLAARDRAMQTLCLGQGATLGVLIGLGILAPLHFSETLYHYFPILTAFLMTAIVYLISQKISQKRLASKNTFFALTFAILLGLSYLASSVFPSLEVHVTQLFFGDLATVTDRDALAVITLSVLSLIALGQNSRLFSHLSFQIAIFGDSILKSREKTSDQLLNAICLVTLAFTIQFMGFLFTISCLFIPTGILRSTKHAGLGRHFILSSMAAGIGTVTGFMMSVANGNLPTVPTVVLAITLVSLGLLATEGHSS